MIAATSTVLTAWNAAIATATASQPSGVSGPGEPSRAKTPTAALIPTTNWPALKAIFTGTRRRAIRQSVGGLAAEILRGMREIAGRQGLRHVIAPVRPSSRSVTR